MLIFNCQFPQNILGLWYPFCRIGNVSAIHLTLSYDLTNDRNIGDLGRNTWVFIYFLTWVSLTLIPWVKESLFPCLGCCMSVVSSSRSTLCLFLPCEADLCGPYQQTFLSSGFQLDLTNGSIYRRSQREERKTRAFINFRVAAFICLLSKLLSGDSVSSLFVEFRTSNHSFFSILSLGVIIAILCYQLWWFLYYLPSSL